MSRCCPKPKRGACHTAWEKIIRGKIGTCLHALLLECCRLRTRKQFFQGDDSWKERINKMYQWWKYFRRVFQVWRSHHHHKLSKQWTGALHAIWQELPISTDGNLLYLQADVVKVFICFSAWCLYCVLHWICPSSWGLAVLFAASFSWCPSRWKKYCGLDKVSTSVWYMYVGVQGQKEIQEDLLCVDTRVTHCQMLFHCECCCMHAN